MKFRKLAAVVAAASVASAMAVSASAFTAGLGYQTGAYGFRNNPWQTEGVWWNEGEQDEYSTWEYTDVDITGDGQYTVSFNASHDDGSQNWNMLMLYFMTSASENGFVDGEELNISVTIDKLTIDGKEYDASKAVFGIGEAVRPDDYSDAKFADNAVIKDPMTVTFYNTYNKDIDGVISGSDFGNKVEVTFTVSGMSGAGDNTPAADGTDNQPVAGDTTQNTGDKTTPDTGVEGVAVVAGIAVIAAGAIVVAKKRK